MSHVTQTWPIAVEGSETTAVYEPATAEATGAVFVCAHGAGGHMDDKAVVAVTRALRAAGIATVRFNFLYRALKQGRPDPMPRLTACVEAVVETVRAQLAPRPLIIGGRSMGGRAASVFASQGGTCDGLLLLAYPLHPPGQPEKLRVAHLPAIRTPVLCINGTRDPFCTPELMQQTLDDLGPNWRMRWLSEADHSFHVLKRSGRTDAAVLAEVVDATREWARAL